MLSRLRIFGLVATLLLSGWSGVAQARGDYYDSDATRTEQRQTLAVVSVAELPPEGRETLRAIKQGGPFEYHRDGVVFSNFERVLPRRTRGYYHEYTVKTPRARNRGARRIVCGPLPECYYTPDHYQTFKRIKE